ncbi:GNAT family N-acetyltransferase [Aliiroseovarius sp. S1339]|uniref:GNAT family N-acetyltransferase n=1 Tax=Aliiroseovarius sp. S1339 TaxID=2936990 RepID=UPI0020BF2375|nr:GNAT family N-acetyltransferase [Aliiroseovarius sp. S1339]MCK8464077.1 GNAT family N-acetyltransferase [Aliiroseovarius sp. S1339]
MSDEISVHLLGPHNAHLLAGSDVFDSSVDPKQLAAFLAAPGHQMVFATIGARTVGFASGTVLLHPDKQPAFFINEVGVSENMRRRGIATSLCELLLKTARDSGCQSIWLATEADNIEARALYKRLNARETSGVVVYDWDGVK